MIDKYFVRVVFTVLENGDKQKLNTPGGDQVMTRWGGETSIPFFAFLDSHGALIANSIEPPSNGENGGNIGHPYEPHEVDWFLTMLQKAAPRMTAEERAPIEKYLRSQKQ